MSKPLPSPSLVVLIGAPASGKSTWAAENFNPSQIVSSDDLRGVIGEHDLDLAATDDAFELLERIVEMRLGRRLTTVVDTTGLDVNRRSTYLEVARRFNVPTVAVRFSTSAAECKRRNRERPHPVPVKAIDAMVKLARSTDLTSEGWEAILEPEPVRMVTAKLAEAAIATEHAPSGDDRPDELRFGLLVSRYNFAGGSGSIGPTLARIAQQAEEVGFDSLWLMDHMIQIPQVGASWDPMLDSYTTLGFVANATTRIRLGVLVSAVTFRNVGHLAKMIATLDVLSDGRAIAGLGAANSKHEHDAYGWDFPEPPDRLARLEDALRALPLLWGPGSPSFEGKTLSIPDTTSYPRPIQDPVPIIVGGSGERVTLRLAAQYAAGCNLFGDGAALLKRIELVRGHCLAAGRDFADFDMTHLGEVLIGHDRLDLGNRIERLRPANVGPNRYAASVNAGTVDDHEARFRSMATAGVKTAIVSTPDLEDSTTMDTFGEVFARFSPLGTSKSVRRQP